MKYFDAMLETDEIDWGELVSPSEEQMAILEAILAGNSVKVIANAGTGKTTLSLQIAKAFLNKRVLILTFNAQNKIEGAAKVVKHKLFNCEYNGFDAFFSKITGRNTSNGIDPKDVPLFKSMFRQKVEILVIDEAQDLKEKYYQEILTIIKANPGIQVVAVGDPRQAVSETFGANNHDHRFFIFLDRLLNVPFKTLALSVTYRHGQEICDLVERGTSVAPPTKIMHLYYSNRNPWETYSKIQEITKGWDENKSVFLAPAPRLFSSDLEYISSANSLFYISDSRKEFSKMEEEYRKNKRCLLSVHRAKGLEWDNVLYFMKHNYKTERKHVEILDYVALTRARKNLIIVHIPQSYLASDEHRDEPLSVTSLSQYINTDYASEVLEYGNEKSVGEPLQLDFNKEYVANGKKILENESLLFEAKIKGDAMEQLELQNSFIGILSDIGSFMKENHIPHNNLGRKWEDFERKDITQNLVDFLRVRSDIWIEQELKESIQGNEITGRTDFISYGTNEVIELKIKNGDFTIEDKIQLALYCALLSKEKVAKNFTYILYNPVTQKTLQLLSPVSVCRDVLEKQVYFRTMPEINTQEFLEKYKVWEQ